MRIGIYSGSFDPVHNGHIALAEEALIVCGLDRLVFLPEALPRGKPAVTPLGHRLRMLELATAGVPAFSVIGLRSERFSTSETLPEIEGLFPEASYTLIVGSDVVHTFASPNRWKGLTTLLKRMDLAIGLRGGDTRDDVDLSMAAIPGARYAILDPVHGHVSSTTARGDRGGLEDVPEVVAGYITKYALYL